MYSRQTSVMLSLLAFCTSINAAAIVHQTPPNSQFTASVYLGGTTTILHPSDVYLVGETDILVPDDHSQSDFSFGLGVGYRFTPDLSLGLDFFYFDTEQSGEVWQYGIVEFNNFDYQMPAKTYRLLADLEWTLKPIFQTVYPFLEAGVGAAANTMSFHENPVPTYSNPGLDISPHTHYDFAYTLGGGLKYPINNRLDISVRYLYANLGTAIAGQDATIPLASPLSSMIFTHAWLAGLTYAF